MPEGTYQKPIDKKPRNVKSAHQIFYNISGSFAAGKSLEDTLYKIVALICKEFNCSCSIVWLKDKDGSLRYSTSWYISKLKNSTFIDLTKNTVYQPGKDLPGKVLKNKKPQFFSIHSKKITSERYKAAVSLGIRQIYSLPIVTDKRSVGLIEIFCNENRKPDAEQRKLLKRLLPMIGIYILRKQEQAKINLSEEKSEILSQLAPVIIYSADSMGSITSLNPATSKITGIKRSKLLGKPLTRLICKEDRDHVQKRLNETRYKGNSEPIEAGIITKNGHTHIGEIREKVKKTNKNDVVEIFGIIRDVTDRYNLEKQRDMWIGIATHELKSPLTSIKAFNQILRHKLKHTISNQYYSYLIRIDELTDRMTSLINDLTQVTKVKSGTMLTKKSSVNLKDLIVELISDLQPAIETHKIINKISTDYYISGDRYRLRELFTNLIENAVKYSPGKKNVKLQAESTNNSIVISVTDYGLGIKAENIKSIFEPFYREKASKSSASGLGLGLYISRAIARAHNGDIWVESIPNKKTTFYVTLPLKQEKHSKKDK
jgi:PAS domain S-box-containing protein